MTDTTIHGLSASTRRHLAFTQACAQRADELFERLADCVETAAINDYLTNPSFREAKKLLNELRDIRDGQPAVSFAEFRTGRKMVKNLDEHFPGQDLDELPGFVYLDGALWIQITTSGAFYVAIESEDFLAFDLEDVEQRLYDYALESEAIARGQA